MRIGEVHTLLRQDFPDIELSKIRYYEDKGLVQPESQPQGLPALLREDVDCLREAIRLAQEEFVPLRVVRLRLIEQGLLEDAAGGAGDPSRGPRSHGRRRLDAGAEPGAGPTSAEPLVARMPGASRRAPLASVGPRWCRPSPVCDDPAPVFTLSEFLAETGLDARPSTRCARWVLLTRHPADARQSSARVTFEWRACVRSLLDRGVDLRVLGSVRRIAEREISMVDDLTAALRARGSEIEPEAARAITADVAREVAALRRELYERALEEYLEPRDVSRAWRGSSLVPWLKSFCERCASTSASSTPLLLLEEVAGRRVLADLHRRTRSNGHRLRASRSRGATADVPRPARQRHHRTRRAVCSRWRSWNCGTTPSTPTCAWSTAARDHRERAAE